MAITFSQLGKMGRLANQLLQAGTVISHAIRTGNDWILPHWEYEKDFYIPTDKFTNYIRPHRTYTEPHFHYAPIPKANGQEVLDLNGYFQSYLYLDEEAKKYLTPRYNPEWNDGKCSIHVRRQDYLKFANCHPFPGMNYYEKAMEQSGFDRFIVFSDDITWCRNHFMGNQFEFSEGLTNVQDLAVMSRCAGNIIANSSFSWFAAWLNKNINKKVFYPNVWFGPGLAYHDTKDLCPLSWIKI